MANPRERQNSQQWNIPLEIQSAYWANTNSNAPANPNTDDDRRFLPVPQNPEPPYNNAGPATSSSDKKKRKPASLRSLIRRRADGEPSSMQPNSNINPNSTSLSPYTYYPQSQNQNQSQSQPQFLEPLRSAPANLHAHRSMPSSPSHGSYPAPLSRAHSAHVQPTPPLSTSPPPPSSQHQHQHQHTQQRYSALDPPSSRAPRASRTYPEAQRDITTAAASLQQPPARPRPQTWLEPFDDASQFHLFVEATSGLPADA
ncbi:hypothetical protein AOQ84DRAFT_366167, partial [Glonium stellatum]